MATYFYTEFLYQRGKRERSAPVEIVRETAKKYLIRLIGVWVGRHAPGTTMWVYKKNVKTEKPPVDCTNDWWQK